MSSRPRVHALATLAPLATLASALSIAGCSSSGGGGSAPDASLDGGEDAAPYEAPPPYDGGPLPAQSTDWPQYAHDAQRTAANPEAVPTPWRWRWNWNESGAIHLANRAEPVTGNGAAYLGALDGTVYALDLATGAQRWSHKVGGPIAHALAFDPGTPAVYVPARDGAIYALDLGDGHELAKLALDGPIEVAPLIVDRTLYVGTTVGTAYAIVLPAMTVAWKKAHAGRAITSPFAYSSSQKRVVVELGKIAAGLTSDGLVHTPDPSCQTTSACLDVEALDAVTGDLAWTAHVNGVAFEGTSPVVSDASGLVLVRTDLRWAAQGLDALPSGRAPATLSATVDYLKAHPEARSFFALHLTDGASAFEVPVLYGATGEPRDEPEGDPRDLYNHAAGIALRRVGAQEKAYTWIRTERACPTRPDGTQNPNRTCGRPTTCDFREDSTLAEIDLATYATRFLELDCHAVRRQTDEINALSLAGDQLFSPNPNNGVGALRVLDAGTHGASVDDPIPTETLPQLAHAVCPGGSTGTQCKPGGAHECTYSLPVHADDASDATCGYGVAGFWVFDDGGRHETWSDGATWSAQTHVVIGGGYVLYRLASSTVAAFSAK
jgi:outer membrane protein assembly factor BamB